MSLYLWQTNELGDKNDKALKPAKLAAFYKKVGGDYDSKLSLRKQKKKKRLVDDQPDFIRITLSSLSHHTLAVC